jgi:hypothetical protein
MRYAVIDPDYFDPAPDTTCARGDPGQAEKRVKAG